MNTDPWVLFNVYGQWHIGRRTNNGVYRSVRQVLSGWEHVVDRQQGISGLRSFFTIVPIPPFQGPVIMTAPNAPFVFLGYDEDLPRSIKEGLERCEETEREGQARSAGLVLPGSSDAS